MAPRLPPSVQRLINKLSESRDCTISIALHAILVAVFGGTVLFHAVKEPSDFLAGDRLVDPIAKAIPEAPELSAIQAETTFDATRVPSPPSTAPLNPIDSQLGSKSTRCPVRRPPLLSTL
jgi:hypothetical protein